MTYVLITRKYPGSHGSVAIPFETDAEARAFDTRHVKPASDWLHVTPLLPVEYQPLGVAYPVACVVLTPRSMHTPGDEGSDVNGPFASEQDAVAWLASRPGSRGIVMPYRLPDEHLHALGEAAEHDPDSEETVGRF